MSTRRLISSTIALVLAGALTGLATAATSRTSPGHLTHRAAPSRSLAMSSVVVPTVTLTSQPPTSTSATIATIAWTSSGATTTTCSRDSTTAVACTSPVNLTGVSLGSHTFSVRVANTAGSNHALASWTVTAAASNPSVTIDSSPPTSTTSTSATFAFSTANATSVSCSIDAATATACTGSIAYNGLTVGPHTFTVAATSGTVTASATFSWTVTAPPTVTIDSNPSASTTSTSATFAFSTANATSVSCSIDAAAATACTGSVVYNGLTIGTHTFTVTATSSTGTASATFSWTVTPPPQAANLWVDVNGGTCPYSSTPTAYNDATACGTFQAALAALPKTGGTSLVKCGIYPPQVLTTAGKTGLTTISSEMPRCATIEASGAVALTLGNGVSYVTLDSLTVNGMIRGSTTTGLGNNHVTISHDDINVGKKVDGPSVSFFVGDYVSLVSNTIGPACCGFNGGKGASPEGIRIGKPNLALSSCTTQVCHLLIDDNLIQNVVRDCALYPVQAFGACPDQTCTNAVGCHQDGIHIWGVDGGTVSRNRLYGVECQAIFFENTNGSLQRNVSIVDNAISGVPGGCGNKGIYLKASGTTDGATNGFAGTWTIAFNSGVGLLIGPNGCGSCWPSATFQLIGNDMPLFATNASGNGAGCTTPWGLSTVSYQYNIWRSGTACGATDLVASPAFVNQVNAPMVGDDYHLGSTGAADNFVPAAVCDPITTQDMDGASRPVTGYCDAGADDR
jgi:hypothetical protein